MARITTTLVVFLILSNGAVTVMEASGLSDDLGVQLAPGISERVDTITTEMRGGFQPGTGIVDSLLSLAISVGNLFLLLVESTYAIPTAMTNLGFPIWAVTAAFAPIYLLATLEMALVILGRRSP